MMRIIFATNNLGKVSELKSILKDFNVVSLTDLNIDINPEETGSTYEENALIKLNATKIEMEIKNMIKKDDIIVADDSGLSVDILDGAPGIYSARFGNFKDDSVKKCEYLLKCIEEAEKDKNNESFNSLIEHSRKTIEVKQSRKSSESRELDKSIVSKEPKESRQAKFVCVLCAYINGNIKYYKGELKGHIGFEMKGNSGFGYDPLFIPDGYDKTVAELTKEEKNRISHRARAVEKFKIDLINM